LLRHFSGAALYVTLVEHPARMECGTQLAATQFGPSYRRAAIMQALLDVVGSLLAALVWVRGGSVAWLAGAALFVSIVTPCSSSCPPTNNFSTRRWTEARTVRAPFWCAGVISTPSAR
jgi:hypothetical protein